VAASVGTPETGGKDALWLTFNPREFARPDAAAFTAAVGIGASDQSAAPYALLLDHSGGKGLSPVCKEEKGPGNIRCRVVNGLTTLTMGQVYTLSLRATYRNGRYTVVTKTWLYDEQAEGDVIAVCLYSSQPAEQPPRGQRCPALASVQTIAPIFAAWSPLPATPKGTLAMLRLSGRVMGGNNILDTTIPFDANDGFFSVYNGKVPSGTQLTATIILGANVKASPPLAVQLSGDVPTALARAYAG